MKKIISVLAFMLITPMTFGYSYGDYERMNTYSNIELFISVIFGILSLILFFKIWGMTDNIKRIKEILEKGAPDDSTSSFINSKKEKQENDRYKALEQTGEWAKDITAEEKKNAIAFAETLSKGQCIILYNKEIVVSDSSELSQIKGNYKILYIKK